MGVLGWSRHLHTKRYAAAKAPSCGDVLASVCGRWRNVGQADV